MDQDKKYHTKRLTLPEYHFIKIIVEHDKGIIPEVIRLDEKEVVYEKYPFVLADFINQTRGEDFKEYDEKIKSLVKRLHDIGIFHGDLHDHNIVINPETGDVRLIDFDNSYFIKDLVENENTGGDLVATIANFLDEPWANSVNDLLKIEYDFYHM